MIKEDAPELKEFDLSVSTLEFYDFPVASGTAIDAEAEVANADATLQNYFGGFYVYGKENYWSHLWYTNALKAKKAGERMQVCKLTIDKDGEYTLYFDDYGFSKENVESKEFGQYDFYNGTSMATPYVTGAVAVLKSLYPKETTMETRMRLIGSTTKKEALKDKTVTEGVLDLSKAVNPNPVISGGSIDEKGVVTVEGAFFGENPSLTVNGIQVTPLSSSNGKITFQGETNTTLNVEITRGDLKTKKKLLFVSGKEIKKKGAIDNLGSFGSQSVVSDGDKLYYIGEAGDITTYDVNNDSAYMAADLLGHKDATLPILAPKYGDGMYDATKLFEEETKNLTQYEVYSFANSIAHSKELYSALCLDLGYTQTNILARYDVTKSEWVRVTELPKELKNLGAVSMASYAGKIYLLGGYNLDKMESVSTVYSYDTQKNTWKKEADMPGAKFFAKAVQTNGKLVVTLGGNGKEASGDTYIFDGTSWTVGAKLEGVLDTSEALVPIPYEEGIEPGEDETVIPFMELAFRTTPYYEAVVGTTDEGLIYSGTRVEKLGNTFTYNLSKNAFATTGKMLTTKTKNDLVDGAVIGKKFYVLSGTPYSEEEYFGDYGMTKGQSLIKNVQQESNNDYGFEDTDNMIYISTENINHNTVNVVQSKDYLEGYVHGVGKYEVGDTIKLTAVPYEGYFVKDLYVNGKKVKNGYTVTAVDKQDGMKVTATFGKYVTAIDIPLSLNVVEGSSQQLTAMPFPMDANDKTLTWSSSDTSVVTVSQTGKITAKKGMAGETAVIKVTAKDRGKVSAYCTVRVEEKVEVSKVQITASKKTVKAGSTLKLTAKVTPSNASNKKVTWKTSNKKYATVNNQGIVTAKKAGKGKTVTITATSVSNPKVKGTIKIKIKK